MIFLSPYLLGIYKECPRCFWLHVNRGHKRPGGAFPSLPGGMDLIIKGYFDKYRGKLPPEIQGKVRGVLFNDLETLNRWRNWKTSLRIGNEEWSLYGAFDDILVDPSARASTELSRMSSGQVYIPIDFKTRASEAKEETKEFYQHQLDLYTLLLNKNGYKTDGTAYLIYFYPKSEEENGIFRFEITPEEIKTSLNDAQNLINKAVETLQRPVPKEHTECAFCNWHKLIAEFD